MSVQVSDCSDDIFSQDDLCVLMIDPIIVHLVSVNGTDWLATVSSPETPSNLTHREFDVFVQIMDLDLSKESNQDQVQRLLEQDKHDGPRGAENILERMLKVMTCYQGYMISGLGSSRVGRTK
jgi:hypothetical protein